MLVLRKPGSGFVLTLKAGSGPGSVLRSIGIRTTARRQIPARGPPGFGVLETGPDYGQGRPGYGTAHNYLFQIRKQGTAYFVNIADICIRKQILKYLTSGSVRIFFSLSSEALDYFQGMKYCF